jgi:hypothetical protein
MLFITSGSMMLMLSFFRDTSRAPFLLAVTAITLALVAQNRTRKYVLAMSALAGIVAGVGFGFRADMLALLPLFVVASTLLFPSSEKKWKPSILLPAVVFVAVFFVSAFPILQAYSANNFIYANFQRAEGLVTPFNENLGLGTSYYDHGNVYRDNFSFITILAFEARGNDLPYETNDGALPTAEADLSDSSRAYNLEIARNYPADTLIRIIGSI